MATLDSVQNPGINAEVDPTHRALRVSVRPLEHQTLAGKILGHYRIFGQTSAIAPTANAVLGLLRWTDPTNFLVIKRVYATVTDVTAITAQRTDPLLLLVARSYTVAETTNVTQLTISGNNQKVRANMSTTLAASVAVASAAAGMTGGTKTNDANAFGALAFGMGVAFGGLGTGDQGDLYKWDQLGQHPIVLQTNEGVLLTWGTTTLATGTVTVGFGIEWAEVSAF